MQGSRRIWLGLLLALFCYGASIHYYNKVPRHRGEENLSVALPPELQVPLALGDRYLAANIASYRAVVLDVPRSNEQDIHALALVQHGASVLNPAHEDNYYIAQAVLPWNGEVDANEFIQQRAMQSRTWDLLPGFFYAFNYYYFRQDYVTAGRILYSVAERNPADKDKLVALAARWQEKGRDLDAAIQLVKSMMQTTRSAGLKSVLQQRLDRLVALKALREAALRYKTHFGKTAPSLHELVRSGMLKELPQDPLGLGYELDSAGVPVFSKQAAK